MILKYTNKTFFVVLIALWLSVLLADGFGRVLLDKEFFAFRAWEVVTDNSTALRPFCPNCVFEKTIFGDLANMLKVRSFRRYRHQRFSTDSHGFRNPASYDTWSNFPIVVIGDSNMAGSSLTDDNTFSYQLSRKLGVPVYNYAPCSLIAFLSDTRFHDSPPKILIWEALEYTIIGENYAVYESIPKNVRIAALKNKRSEPKRTTPRLSDYGATILFHELLWKLTGYHTSLVDISDKEEGMLFYNESLSVLSLSAEERGIDTVTGGIKRAQELCSARGITLIYMPLPNKETVYHEMVPKVQREAVQNQYGFLEALHVELTFQGIQTLNLYQEFNNQAGQGKLLYYLDGTHWNSEGVAVAADMTARLIRDMGILDGNIAPKD